MNLLQLGIKLGAENIQSFIDDFLKVDGISISDIQLHDNMILINKIRYKSFGTLSVGFRIDRMEDGVLSISVKKIKAVNISISVLPVNLILKMVLNKVGLPGLTWDDTQIKIDLFVIFKELGLDFLSLKIKDVQITRDSINILIDDLDMNMKKVLRGANLRKQKEEGSSYKVLCEADLDKGFNLIDGECVMHNFEDCDDGSKSSGAHYNFDGSKYFYQYSNFRDSVYRKHFPNNVNELLGKVLFLLPDIVVLAYRLLRDRRVGKSKKFLLVFTLVYVLNPFDRINKSLRVLDKVDDGLLVIFTLSKIFTSIDRRIISYHFDGSDDTLNFLIDAFDVLNQFMGLDKINRLYTIFEKFVK